MPAPPKHKDAIVDAAVTLFRRRGYAGTGLNDIVELSGAPKGSLYHYFPDGKASIAEAAVREAGRRVAATAAELAAEAANAGDLIKAHAGLLAEWMAQSGYRDGSPVTTVLLELAPIEPAVTAAGRDVAAAWRQVIADKLAADGIAPNRAERLAALCTAALDGALVQARVQQSAAPLHTVSEELAALLRSETA
jgi:TetR/AcrR family transcriptional repressor of lmrAB and yxaGH operons